MIGRARSRDGAADGSAAGRPPAAVGGDEFLEALESVSCGIRDPVAKLRYLRTSLARYGDADRALRAVPYRPLRRALYRWLSLEGLRRLMGGESAIPIDPRVRRSLGLRRAAVFALAACGVSALALALHVWLRPTPPSPVVAAATETPRRLAVPAPAATPEPLAVRVDGVAPARRGVAPARIWLVEKGAGYEQYSNGLRIDTTHTVAGDTRRFRVFDREGRLSSEVQGRPAGLLFHTSESDVWPLEAEFNENLRDSSQRLLRYVQRNKLYNYLVDRFGRVYRVVEETAKANHSGNSVWAHGDRVYLNLNHPFLGVCFETRWEGAQALPITEAQFAAGRALTDVLRQKWDIPPEMCTAHGLASVNPVKRLIGHHMDWSRGFPFEAFGLPDQYAVSAASVELFGFWYDDDFLKVLPEPWPGVTVAGRVLEAEAARRGATVEQVRRERQARYDAWREQARMADAPTRGAGG